MSKLKTNAKRMVEDLGLKWKPIGAKFSDSPGEFNLSTDKVSICELFTSSRMITLPSQ